MTPDELARFNEGTEILGIIFLVCVFCLFLILVGKSLSYLNVRPLGDWLYMIGFVVSSSLFVVGMIVVISI